MVITVDRFVVLSSRILRYACRASSNSARFPLPPCRRRGRNAEGWWRYPSRPARRPAPARVRDRNLARFPWQRLIKELKRLTGAFAPLQVSTMPREGANGLQAWLRQRGDRNLFDPRTVLSLQEDRMTE